MNGFIIRRNRSWKARLMLLLLLLLLPPLLLLIYLDRVEVDWKLSLPWGAADRASSGELLDENTELKEKLLVLEQNSQVDKQAVALLQRELKQAQEENFRLREDLEFYQGIMNVQHDKNSPVVHGLRIRPLTQGNGYRLELILLHVTNKDELFEGVLDIVVTGRQEGETKRLPLRGISLDKNRDYAVRFRNFQRFENNFVLPDAFEAQTIEVTVSINDKEKSKLEKIFDWPVTANVETENVG